MSQRKPTKQGRYGLRPWAAPVFLVSLALFITGAVGTGSLLAQGQQEDQAFRELAQRLEASALVETAAAETLAQGPSSLSILTSGEGTEAAPERQMLARYADVYARNGDTVGWVTVPGTKVNYPVMNTPEDPHYYLHKDFDKKESTSGTPFYGEGCTDDSDCLMIYAHNMKNGAMFGSLYQYEKKSFWEEHQTVHFDTLYQQREYQIIAVFKGRVLYQDEEGFRYYRYTGDLSQKQFEELMQGVKEREFYSTGVSAAHGDQLLMLSTCSNHGENDRLVLVAKRVEK